MSLIHGGILLVLVAIALAIFDVHFGLAVFAAFLGIVLIAIGAYRGERV